MKIKRCVAVGLAILSICTMSICLCSCSAGKTQGAATATSSSSAKYASSKFVGTWDLTSADGTSAGSVIPSIDLEMFANYGTYISLSLIADGTYLYDFLGEEKTGTWKEISSTTASAVIDGEYCELTLADTSLKLKGGNNNFTFKQCTHASHGEKKESSEYSSLIVDTWKVAKVTINAGDAWAKAVGLGSFQVFPGGTAKLTLNGVDYEYTWKYVGENSSCGFYKFETTNNTEKINELYGIILSNDRNTLMLAVVGYTNYRITLTRS